MEEGMTQANDERINRYNQRIVEASEKMMPKAEGECGEGKQKRRQEEKQEADQMDEKSTADDQQMQEPAAGSQDPAGSQHRGRKRGEEEKEEERPGKWRREFKDEGTMREKRSGSGDAEGPGKKSRTGDELQIDWVHDARDDEECRTTVRDMDRRGRVVIVTRSKSRKEATHETNEVECAEIIRSQVGRRKGYLHEVGSEETGECVKWSAGRGSEVYQVRWGTTSWITNMKEVSEAAKDMRRRGEDWGLVVKTGVRNFMRNKGMINDVDEYVSHNEDPKVQPEEG
jgi:hypothetical protein